MALIMLRVQIVIIRDYVTIGVAVTITDVVADVLHTAVTVMKITTMTSGISVTSLTASLPTGLGVWMAVHRQAL